MSELIDVPRGLNGVVAAETRVGDVDGDAGFFHYRGHSAVELARTRSVEDVWHLLVLGHLPDDAERSAFATRIARAQTDERMPGLVAAVRAHADEPLAVLRATWTLAASVRRSAALYDSTRPPGSTRRSLSPPWLRSPSPRIQAERARARRRLPRTRHRTPPRRRARAGAHGYLVATMDHGFNASTFTARSSPRRGPTWRRACAARSALSPDPCTAARPPAPSTASTARATTRGVDRGRARRGSPPDGFGHAVYRTADRGRSSCAVSPRGSAASGSRGHWPSSARPSGSSPRDAPSVPCTPTSSSPPRW